MKKVQTLVFLILCMTLLSISGCRSANIPKTSNSVSEGVEYPAHDFSDETKTNAEKDSAPAASKEDSIQQKISLENEISENRESSDSEETLSANENVPSSGVHVIAIDAGHQAKGNSEKEPVGPGSEQMKAKVASGTTGRSTGIPEYELTLAVSLKLRDELQARGYTVIMIRETNDVNTSNAERAQTANSSGAEAFLRIHANGSEDTSVNGALTMCMTEKNPYNGSLYHKSRTLSENVLDGLCAQTGAKKLSIIETDTMTGINWCTIPVTIVEMGFMSNPAEDELMNTDEYRTNLAIGIANGVDTYFSSL